MGYFLPSVYQPEHFLPLQFLSLMVGLFSSVIYCMDLDTWTCFSHDYYYHLHFPTQQDTRQMLTDFLS